MNKHKAYQKKAKKTLFKRKKKKKENPVKYLMAQSARQVNPFSGNDSSLFLIGNKSLYIENYQTILEYTTSHIKVQIKDLIIVVEGCQLDVQYFTNEDMKIQGSIRSITYL